MNEEARNFYELERLWSDLEDDTPAAADADTIEFPLGAGSDADA